MQVLKGLMVYTKGVPCDGGGGRRVFMELLHNFNKLGVNAYSWSLLPIKPELLYEGKYAFEAEYYFDDWNKDVFTLGCEEKKCALVAFMKSLKERSPDFILFDTEYSFREFVDFSRGMIEYDELPPMAVLVHDQIWKQNIDMLSKYTNSSDAKKYEKVSNYPELNRYIKNHVAELVEKYELREVGFAKNIKTRLRNNIYDKIRKRFKYPVCILRGLIKKLIEKILLLVVGKEEYAKKFRLGRLKRDFKNAELLFCLTKRSAKETAAAYGFPQDRVLTAYGYYDPNDFKTTEKSFRSQMATGKSKVLLALSRFSPEKNIEIILLAYQEALKSYSGMQLWVVGLLTDDNLSYYRDLEKLRSKLNLDDLVHFICSVTDDEMNKIYEEADAFICAQVADFNLSVSYALKVGLPVIVFNSYDFPSEINGAAPIYCKNNSVAGLAKSIVNAMEKSPKFKSQEIDFILSCTYMNYSKKILDEMDKYLSGMR